MKMYARRVVGAKTETTQNSAVSLAATDFLAAYDFSIKPAIEQLPSDVVSASLGSPANVVGTKAMDVEVKFWGKGSGSPGTVYAPLDALMQAAGFRSSASAGVSVTYTPQSTSQSAGMQSIANAATIIGNYDGVSQTVPGVVGTMKWSFEAGKKWDIAFTGKGLYGAAADTAIPTATYGAVIEPTVQQLTATVNGVALTIAKLEVDFGGTVQPYDDVNAASGIGGFVVVDRNPVGSIEFLLPTVAFHDAFGLLAAATEMAISFTVGTVAGNKHTVTTPKAQYSNVQHGNKNGQLSITATLKFNESDAASPFMTVVAL